MNVEKARERAKKIKLLVLDCDGVLTDGGLYYDAEGHISKRFNVQDGLGIKLLQGTGVHVAVISGLDSKAVATRVDELDIEEYHAGHLKKIPLLEGIMERLELTPDQVAYMGDDWVDAGPLRLVGLPMAPANAQPEILDLALYVTRAEGGHGAVREGIRLIMEAQGTLGEQFAEWGSGA